MFLDLPRRVAKVLLSQPRGADGVIRLRMSQEELAHQVGGTRQSVNAALRGFERRGWLSCATGPRGEARRAAGPVRRLDMSVLTGTAAGRLTKSGRLAIVFHRKRTEQGGQSP